jgi:hypothetical protein
MERAQPGVSKSDLAHSSNRNGPTSVPAEPTHAFRMAARPEALPAASHSRHRDGARSRMSCRASFHRLTAPVAAAAASASVGGKARLSSVESPDASAQPPEWRQPAGMKITDILG